MFELTHIKQREKAVRQVLILAFLLLMTLLTVGPMASAIENGGLRQGMIAGKVLEGLTGNGIPLVEIQIWNEAGEYSGAVLTDMDGVYTVDGLNPGRYFAATVESGFPDSLFEGHPCPFGECDPTLGTPIEVSGGATTTNINFVLIK